MTTVTKQEQTQVDKANASGKTPVVFLNGLWLLPSSWDRRAKHFEGAAGFASLSPGLARRSGHVQEARQHPEILAKKSISQVADHSRDDPSLSGKPVVIVHSFGGLMTEILAGRGLAAVFGGDLAGRFARSCPYRSLRFGPGLPSYATPAIATAP
jgi:non-heme chloroperoxidase